MSLRRTLNTAKVNPKQLVLLKWPNAYCYRLAPKGLFGVILGNPPSVFVQHTSANLAWKIAARRMKL